MSDVPSKAQILDAAERLFSAQGFSGTTIKQIGHAAGVNSALLYYYFDDKERLYRSVLERLVGQLVLRTLERLKADASPSDRIRGFIEAQVETFVVNPELPRLFMREMLDHDATHAVEQIQHLAATSFKALCDTIAEGQKQGAFRSDVDPKFAAISTVGQVAYFFLARPAVRILLGADRDLSHRTIVAFARHAADFSLAALGSGARRPRKRRTR
ncbi:MAG TPA: TetR/AcrR family transcriptional regulator [Gemmatimonadales bacterium]|nr:TetR/AcrR family transcriptional regulator [Gemmatimonadales bacterium]